MALNTANALESTRLALAELDALLEGRWHLERDLGPAAGRLTGQGTPQELLAGLHALAPLFATASLTGTFADAKLTLTVMPDGTFASTVEALGDINDNFDVDDRGAARRAWAGDAQAALALPGGVWTTSVQIKWTSTLESAVPSTQWLLFWSVDDAIGYLRDQGFLRLKLAIDSERGAVVLIRGLAPESRLETPALTVASIDASDVRLPAPSVEEPWTEEPVLANSIEPRLLLPLSPDRCLTAVVDLLSAAIVGTCWTRLATSTTTSGSGEVEVEYFGLQRVRHRMSAAGPAVSLEQARSSVELLDWVESTGTVDRLIAARQVISLRTDEPPWERPEDIEIAAEPIFRALRADAIAEALRAQREARTSALAAAQRSIEAASASAKGTAEKAIAAVVAVGAILTGNTTNALSVDQAHKLQLLVGATLAGLALWNILIERPALFRPINDFKADLGTIGDLLSQKELERISDMTALKKANSYALRVAWMVPALYVALAITAVCIER